MKRSLLLLAGWLPLAAAGAEPALELAGIVAGAPGATAVVLRDRAAAVSSPWLRAGREWQGYRVAVIDEARDAVTLVRGGESRVLALRAAQAASASSQDGERLVVLRGGVALSGGKQIFSPDAVVRFGPFLVSATAGQMECEGGVLRGELLVDDEGMRRILLGLPGASAAPARAEPAERLTARELRIMGEGEQTPPVVALTIGGAGNPFAGAQLRYVYDAAQAGWQVSYREPGRSGR